MACGSVAVSKAQIAQIALAQEELTTMLGKLLGVPSTQTTFFQVNRGESALTHSGGSMIMKYDYMHTAYHGDKWRGVNSISIVQRVLKDKITLELSVSSSNQARANEVQEELSKAFERQTTVAQQTTILKKLAQLGKLSSITQKENGVTARLEISI